MKSDAAQLEKQLRTLTHDLFSSKDLDPWVRECRDIYSPGHRDAFIGNGLIGLRVPPEGEPSVYPVFHAVKMAPGGTQMHGLWDDKGMVPTFNFLGLKIQHGRMVFRRDSGAILNYVQKLDWKTATVTTECDWHHWGCVFHIETKIWLSRSNQNIGCVETTITSDRDTGFSVMDIVDGSFIPGSTPMEYKFGTFYMLPKVVSSRFGGHQVAVATTLTIDGNEAPGHVECTPGGYVRQNVIMIKKDTPCRIVKYAAMVSDAASEDPINTAATLAGYAIENHETMRAEHEKAWAKLWEHNIETDHPGVQMLVNDGLYHLYCNLDEHGKGGVPGPCGLSGNAWANHIFWDAETWSFPPAALMNPGMASNYIKYRVDSLPGARRNAAALGLPGALFPWEGGKSGDELIPGLIYSKQHHINADVILAIWKYYLVTGDETYLKEQAAELIFACADFWAERAVYNEEKDRYEILKVCCPDEGARIQNNNAFTNYGAKFSLELAEKVAGKLNLEVKPEWGKVAGKLWIPVEEEKQYIIEFEGYCGQEVKQGDAILLIYPMEMPMTKEMAKNTCDYYRDKYPAQKIMMSSAIHGIIDAQLGDAESSWKMFLDLLPHFRGDYMLVSEAPYNETISLLTGICGMLQLVMMGWGGLRIHDDGLKAAPNLPDAVNYLKIKGLHYMGEVYDLSVDKAGFELKKR